MLTTASAVEGSPRAPRLTKCVNIQQVFDALGGKHAVCELTGAKFTAVCNWLSLYNRIPSRFYLAVQNELKRHGYIANPALFGME